MPIYKGNTQIIGLYKGDTEIVRRYKGTDLIYESAVWLPYSFEYLYNSLVPQKVNKNPLLPQEYQEVEYIESTGTQYINTGVIFTQNIRALMVSQYNNLGVGRNFSLRQSGGERKYFGAGSNKWIVGYGTAGDYDHNLGNADTDKHTFDYQPDKFLIDNVIMKTYSPFNSTQNIGLFAVLDVIDYLTFMKLYSCQIYDNGTLVRNFVPCYRKSDNVIGLFDTVNQVFYTNAGTGTFSKGNDVYATVKNKARVNTIYGNSVVENQLVVESKKSATKSSFATGFRDYIPKIAPATTYIYGHKYLLTMKLTGFPLNQTLLLFGESSYWNESRQIDQTNPNVERIFTAKSTITTASLDIMTNNQSGAEIIQETSIDNVQFIDLTQMFPIDTPTTLTDVRVQKLLNMGYIPHNSGTLKSVDIGEISSSPYNLLSLDRTQGTTGADSNTTLRNFEEDKYYINFSSDNYAYGPSSLSDLTSNSFTVTGQRGYGVGFPIRCKPNVSYSVKYTASGTGTYSVRLAWYDETGKWLSQDITTTGVAPSNAYWLVVVFRANGTFTYTNPYVYETNAGDLGYKPYKSFSPITFKYQGNGVGTAHDTMEITNTNYVFTKNMGSVDLGSLSWTYRENGVLQTLSIASRIPQPVTNVVLNFLCSIYVTLTPQTTNTMVNQANMTISARISDKAILVKNTAYTDATTFETAMSGVSLYYELATPQVITIPRKHLGIVDLGSLNWNYDNQTAVFYSRDLVSTMKSEGQIVCERYMTNLSLYPSNLTNNTMTNKAYFFARNLCIKDTSYTDPTTFKQSLQGQYLFYETTDEVPDISTQIDIEAGGTLTTDSEVLPNIDFAVKGK